MFHLSLPVISFSECLAFYKDAFDAKIVMLDDGTANLFVFGGQLTFHDNPHSEFSERHRREMHFGHIVREEDWLAIRDRLRSSNYPILKCVDPQVSPKKRAKLIVRDPSGNLVEINAP